MSLSTNTLRNQFNGDNTSVTFSTNFPFLKNSDLLVYVSGSLKTLTTDYSVSGAGNANGGSVTMVTPPPTGTGNVVIIRDPDQLQSSQLPTNDPFPSKTVETALDKLTMLVQRTRDLINRSITLSDSDASGASTTLPSPAANNFLGWNSAANAIINYAGVASTAVSAFMAPVVQAANAAAAWTAFGISIYAQSLLTSANAAAARVTLGAAFAGANNDIVSLGALVSVPSVVAAAIPGQNYFINGSFNVWQDTNGNGATFTWTFAAASGHSADMVLNGSGTGGSPSKTVTRQAWAKSNAANVYNNQYYLSSQQTANATATGDFDFFGIEYGSTFQGGNCTVSALLWCASGTLVLTPTWVQNFGTGGSPSATTSTAPTGPSTITISATPTLYTFTFAVPATTAKTFGTNGNDYCGLQFTRPLNTLSTLNVDSLKIEIGSAVTPYRAPVGGLDFIACKRYYEILGGVAAQDLWVMGYATSGSSVYNTYFHTQKRISPTATKVGTWTLSGTTSQPTANAVSLNSLTMTLSQPGAAQMMGAYSAGSSTYVSLDSRLF